MNSFNVAAALARRQVVDHSKLSRLFRPVLCRRNGDAPNWSVRAGAHGGEIRVQSKPNGGSEFTVLLPMIATEAPTHAPEPQH